MKTNKFLFAALAAPALALAGCNTGQGAAQEAETSIIPPDPFVTTEFDKTSQSTVADSCVFEKISHVAWAHFSQTPQNYHATSKATAEGMTIEGGTLEGIKQKCSELYGLLGHAGTNLEKAQVTPFFDTETLKMDGMGSSYSYFNM